ncbi:MAG: zinc ribbon domain-containing protein [Ruminococcus sp.]|nr:zinc ribbon domain-containing protein [Ruminococcus sp.]
MFCGKCGAKIADGNLFCTSCGKRIIDAAQTQQSQWQTQWQQPQSQPVTQTPPTVQVQPETPKKKSKKKWIALATAAAVLVVGGGGTGAYFILHRGGTDVDVTENETVNVASDEVAYVRVWMYILDYEDYENVSFYATREEADEAVADMLKDSDYESSEELIG